MHFAQPLVRAWHRYKTRWKNAKIPRLSCDVGADCVKKISLRDHDLYFNSKEALGREHLLEELVKLCAKAKWHGDFSAEWDAHDVELLGDGWHDIRIRTATEELGWPKRFTRVRCTLRPAARGVTVFAFTLLWATLALLLSQPWAAAIGGVALAGTIGMIWRSRRRCRETVSRLVYLAALEAHLEPVGMQVARKEGTAKLATEEAEVCLR